MILDPHVQERDSRKLFWRKIWSLFLLSWCSFCSSEGAAIGDTDGGDSGGYIPCEHAARHHRGVKQNERLYYYWRSGRCNFGCGLFRGA